MVFLTFGTGLGAGLILDGKLYTGTNDNAGEVGHIRLEHFGPVGFGKAGSFEGFCSGGGLSQLGYTLALEKIQTCVYPAYFQKGMAQKDVTAKAIAEAANAGDATAKEVFRICGEHLGNGLSIVIDIRKDHFVLLAKTDIGKLPVLVVCIFQFDIPNICLFYGHINKILRSQD